MEKLKFLLVLTVILMAPSFAVATTYVEKIHEFAVSSQEMDGMGVNITFADGTTVTSTWSTWNTTSVDPLAPGKSGVSGTDWSITNTQYNVDIDDTMRNTWTLNAVEGNEITSLTINGVTAGIVFDIINSIEDFPDTPDSMNGWWDGNLFDGASNSGSGTLFSESATGPYFLEGSDHDYFSPGSTSASDIYFDWIFSEGIVVSGQSQTDPLDVWGEFTLNFDNPDTNAIESFFGELKFDLDTDAATVPEPSTILLLGFGLLGLTAVGRKRA